MRTLLWSIAALVSAALVAAGYLVWQNNRPAQAPQAEEIDAALENSIQWLVHNRQSILDNNNPVLWQMLQEAGAVTGDKRLLNLFSDYEKRHISPSSLWRPLFYPHTWTPVRFEQIAHLSYYFHHFIYAITCDSELAQRPDIAAQNAPDYCDIHPLRPACATHQMMGLLMMKRSDCGDRGELEATIEKLQQRITSQLTWDPRVVDVYMQRVLMLVASGAGELVKPIWIRRLLDAQQPDGGWSAFMPLLPLGSDRYLGTVSLLKIGTPHSNFHITAQGVLLFALLSQEHQVFQASG